MKLKQLESQLGMVTQFENPKIDLEQYPTGPHIASRILFTMEGSYGDIGGRVVLDLGCGCGVLTVGAALMGAQAVIGVDVDGDALETARENCEEMEVDADLIQMDVTTLNWTGPLVDTVVMNPPFGTRNKGADVAFLGVALRMCRRSVYSLHKTSTREHIKKAALKEFGAQSAEVLFQLRYDLPASYKFHKKKEVDIAVDFWRFVPSNGGLGPAK